MTRLLVIVLAMSLPAGACTASAGSGVQDAAYLGPLGDAAEQINCNAVVHDHCRTFYHQVCCLGGHTFTDRESPTVTPGYPVVCVLDSDCMDGAVVPWDAIPPPPQCPPGAAPDYRCVAIPGAVVPDS